MSYEYLALLPGALGAADIDRVGERLAESGAWTREQSSHPSPFSIHFRLTGRPRRDHWPEDVSVIFEPSRVVVAFHSPTTDEPEFLRVLAEEITRLQGVTPVFEEA
jgi:hypothetical protein